MYFFHKNNSNSIHKFIENSIRFHTDYIHICYYRSNKKTANIEEKQFQLLTNKKANVIIRHNVNLLEEMTLEGKMKAPIKIDISNCGNDTATNIAISINRIEIPQISFLLPNEIKSVYIGMVDISNHKITLVTGYEFPIEKSNTLHMNIQEIKNTNNKLIIPIAITTDNK